MSTADLDMDLGADLDLDTTAADGDAGDAADGLDMTPEQSSAVAAARRWLDDCRRRRSVLGPAGRVEPFLLTGYAGTGKTTIIRHAVAGRNAAFLAYTGKAAQVLRRKGMPARTIHSLIYRPVTDKDAEKEAAALLARAEAASSAAERRALGAEYRRLTGGKDGRGALSFELRGALGGDFDVLVVDECSMVSDELLDDLLSFGAPTVLLGDPGQLPPVKGAAAWLAGREPDATLTRIHRQAENSPIIKASVLARSGTPIPFNLEPGAPVRKLHLEHLLKNRDLLLGADQVLCGLNRTRSALIRDMRGWLGRREPGEKGEGVGAGERLICLRNDRERAVFNGEQFTVVENLGPMRVKGAACVRLRLAPVDPDPDPDDGDGGGPREFTVPVYLGRFAEHYAEGRINHPTPDMMRGALDMDFAYAVTVHKAQGSEWGSVALADDGWMRWARTAEERADRARWLYTGITRARERLVIGG